MRNKPWIMGTNRYTRQYTDTRPPAAQTPYTSSPRPKETKVIVVAQVVTKYASGKSKKDLSPKREVPNILNTCTWSKSATWPRSERSESRVSRTRRHVTCGQGLTCSISAKNELIIGKSNVSPISVPFPNSQHPCPCHCSFFLVAHVICVFEIEEADQRARAWGGEKSNWRDREAKGECRGGRDVRFDFWYLRIGSSGEVFGSWRKGSAMIVRAFLSRDVTVEGVKGWGWRLGSTSAR